MSANVSIEEADGMSPLLYASMNAQHGIVQLLLKYGAYVDTYNIEGKTPIYVACMARDYLTAKLLLDSGVDKESASWSLPDTIHNNQLKFLTLMLDQKINPSYPEGYTPLTYTLFYGSQEAKALLIKETAFQDALGKFDDNYHDPISHLVCQGDIISILSLQEYKDNFLTERMSEYIVAAVDVNGVNGGHEQIVQHFMRQGIVDYTQYMDRHNSRGNALLVAARKNCSSKKIVQSLLSRDIFNIDGVDESNRTALQWAIEHKNTATMGLLLAKKIQIAIAEETGISLSGVEDAPLWDALYNRFYKVDSFDNMYWDFFDCFYKENLGITESIGEEKGSCEDFLKQVNTGADFVGEKITLGDLKTVRSLDPQDKGLDLLSFVAAWNLLNQTNKLDSSGP